MSARNDKAAVTKAAKAVDRDKVMALISQAVAAKFRRRQPLAPELYPATAEPRPFNPTPYPSPPIWSPTDPVTPKRTRRSRTPKLDNPDSRQIVEKSAWGRMPRYGTIRYTKAESVLAKLRDRTDKGLVTRVNNLVGLYYVHEGKSGVIDRHDLAVMHDKRLINIKNEGE